MMHFEVISKTVSNSSLLDSVNESLSFSSVTKPEQYQGECVLLCVCPHY